MNNVLMADDKRVELFEGFIRGERWRFVDPKRDETDLYSGWSDLVYQTGKSSSSNPMIYTSEKKAMFRQVDGILVSNRYGYFEGSDPTFQYEKDDDVYPRWELVETETKAFPVIVSALSMVTCGYCIKNQRRLSKPACEKCMEPQEPHECPHFLRDKDHRPCTCSIYQEQDCKKGPTLIVRGDFCDES